MTLYSQVQYWTSFKGTIRIEGDLKIFTILLRKELAKMKKWYKKLRKNAQLQTLENSL